MTTYDNEPAHTQPSLMPKATQLLNTMIEQIEADYDSMVETRRDFHMHPELSFEEARTPKIIGDHLKSLGIDTTEDVGEGGVVGILKGAHPGPTIALRADFDALPMYDDKDVPYKSTIPGAAHTCGHDLHTAAMMTLEKVLSNNKNHLHGNVVFIHQHAEELPPGGAQAMIKDGVLKNVDYIYGAHVWDEGAVGEVGFNEGYTMGGGDNFEIIVHGDGGHGAMPHLTVDATVTASQLVVNLQQIVSRHLNPQEAGVVTIGTLNSGYALNAISDKATITGTARCYNNDTKKQLREWVRHIAETTTVQAGGTATINFNYGYDSLYNDEASTRALRHLTSEYSDLRPVPKQPILSAEDFSYYLQEVPGTFFFVGGRNPEINAIYPHHHPKFDMDERSMVHICKVFLLSVCHHLIDEGGGAT